MSNAAVNFALPVFAVSFVPAGPPETAAASRRSYEAKKCVRLVLASVVELVLGLAPQLHQSWGCSWFRISANHFANGSSTAPAPNFMIAEKCDERLVSAAKYSFLTRRLLIVTTPIFLSIIARKPVAGLYCDREHVCSWLHPCPILLRKGIRGSPVIRRDLGGSVFTCSLRCPECGHTHRCQCCWKSDGSVRPCCPAKSVPQETV